MKFWHVLVIAIILGGAEGAMRHLGWHHYITGLCDYFAGVAIGTWIMRK